MTYDLLLTIVAASLLGSTHCAGMCGPFVLLLMGKSGAAQTTTQHSHMATRLISYHLGRLTTYLTLGLLAGQLGHTLNHTVYLVGLQRAAAYLAGITMLVSAAVILLRQLGVPLHHLPVPSRWVKAIYAGFRLAQTWPVHLRAWWVGLLTTFIPCGWLYAFVIVAAGAGHAVSGGLIMLAFWIGTIPLLSMVGYSAGQLSASWRQATPWIAMAACLVLGWMTLFHRSGINLESLHAQLTGLTLASENVPQLNTTNLPCCHED